MAMSATGLPDCRQAHQHADRCQPVRSERCPPGLPWVFHVDPSMEPQHPTDPAPVVESELTDTELS